MLAPLLEVFANCPFFFSSSFFSSPVKIGSLNALHEQTSPGYLV